jgi:hypothetical protein
MSGPMTTADDDEERQMPEVLLYTLVKTNMNGECVMARKKNPGQRNNPLPREKMDAQPKTTFPFPSAGRPPCLFFDADCLPECEFGIIGPCARKEHV